MTSKMKTYLDAQKTRSEVVSRLLEIRALEETPALKVERTELEQKQATVETEFRSALVAVTSEQETGVSLDTAGTELRALTRRANLGGVFTAAMAGSPTDGAEAEIQAHFKLASNQVPIEMLRIEKGVGIAGRRQRSIGHRRRLTSRGHPARFCFRRRCIFGNRAPDRRGRCCKLPDVVHEADRPWSVFG